MPRTIFVNLRSPYQKLIFPQGMTLPAFNTKQLQEYIRKYFFSEKVVISRNAKLNVLLILYILCLLR